MAGEGFIGRWSRLKRDAEAASQPPEQTGPGSPPAAGPPAQVVALAPEAVHGAATPVQSAEGGAQGSLHDRQARERVELPSIDSLGKDSDFSMFMRAEVDPGLRVSALKKLFTDPHFNQMDGLDIYIDDYSKPDPMPLAMLKRLNQSRMLGLMQDEPEEKKPEEQLEEQSEEQLVGESDGKEPDLATDTPVSPDLEAQAAVPVASPPDTSDLASRPDHLPVNTEARAAATAGGGRRDGGANLPAAAAAPRNPTPKQPT